MCVALTLWAYGSAFVEPSLTSLLNLYLLSEGPRTRSLWNLGWSRDKDLCQSCWVGLIWHSWLILYHDGWSELCRFEDSLYKPKLHKKKKKKTICSSFDKGMSLDSLMPKRVWLRWGTPMPGNGMSFHNLMLEEFKSPHRSCKDKRQGANRSHLFDKGMSRDSLMPKRVFESWWGHGVGLPNLKIKVRGS